MPLVITQDDGVNAFINHEYAGPPRRRAPVLPRRPSSTSLVADPLDRQRPERSPFSTSIPRRRCRAPDITPHQKPARCPAM
ncbi:MAG: hypothetical protein ACLU38_01355 [Dysosmobacter sp.]